MANENENPAAENDSGNTSPATPATAADRIIEFDGERMEIPENFWDNENKTANIGALLKSQNDLRKQISTEDQSPKNGVYEITIPEEFAEVVEIDKESPLFKNACEIAKKCRMSQDDFNALVKPYLDELTAPFANAKETLAEEDRRLDQIFGNKKQEALTRIKTWEKNLGLQADEDISSELAMLHCSAGGIKLLHKMATTKGAMMPMAGGDGSGEILSESKLREMMQDARYWRDHEPEYVKKVTEGFQRLYPDKQGA